MSLVGKRIVLIMSGSIAVYKCLDLIRRMCERGVVVIPVLTSSAQKFITPMLVNAISNSHVYAKLFSCEPGSNTNHIQLARDCDLLVVAPASANFIARIAHGMAYDLASAIILSKQDRPVLLAPAMNPTMWFNPATQRNVDILRRDGIFFVGPEEGAMAENDEIGLGRMSEPLDIIACITRLLGREENLFLTGKRAVVTSGPTYEPLDPVRYITNRSTGRQGHAIAESLAHFGADVTLISGPVSLADPPNVKTIRIERTEEMFREVLTTLPVDIAVMVSAVSDWRLPEIAKTKIKRRNSDGILRLNLIENPDILKSIGHHKCRPSVVVGFAAETQHLEENAQEKLSHKGANFIVANSVLPKTGFIGEEYNQVSIVSPEGIEKWPKLLKKEVAHKLCFLIAKHLKIEDIVSEEKHF
ncbi:bifunctional phosphopantothenoylcysteine decarboxylase/phosphopantothenate--cysteine ligase CoaBC [Candidatus Liberibacter sp.]|uniref:bifunctional phosphopantothenoylcysteine decarboxylase/phosphopantothenate--cysteine ligase CoaBC n=1 Tax=Candidatus Liberibacter sp. TaxID=34022 RepID=UPI0015F3C06D|nr:bifunctional phosphopantothenoylcysteine decarboxylase/phosphopantothenate--cysteine ligase CoaBC [Candidatus Liberibacter sp.]MBA5723692.1 bifunctional phosphopantothenoylcysteine decarboxylase/phosphopantothenate--cysteine ligase CoaBC [Candidatus Liberibacter sp.]